MKLAEKETVEKFGYSINSLKTRDKKPIVLLCDTCDTPIVRTRNLVKPCKTFNCQQCTTAKRTKTNIEKYGAANTFASTAIKEKIKKSNLEKYGVENVSCSKEIKEKKKETLLSNYGVESPLQNKEILSKATNTNLERYGVANAMYSAELKTKLQNTNIEKYGKTSPLANEEVKKKIAKTVKEKYRVNHPMQNAAVKKKVQTTNMKKYGYLTNLLIPETREIPKHFGKTQNEIKDFLFSKGFEFSPNYNILNGKEIDLYNDELKLGIEYCGLYWHSEGSARPVHNTYHQEKYINAKNKGVQLITIFEDEWLHQRRKVEQLLVSCLPTPPAEYKITCEKLTNETAQEFTLANFSIFEEAEIYLGIYANSILTAVIGCNLDGTNLAINTINNFNITTLHQNSDQLSDLVIKTITTYYPSVKIIKCSTDNRYIESNLLTSLKFIEAELTEPDYTIAKLTGTRLRFDKTTDMTELVKGYSRKVPYAKIWDCGKTHWHYTIN